MNSLSTKEIVKIGIIVKDAKASASAYAKLFGIDEPNVFTVSRDDDPTKHPDTWYKGEAILPPEVRIAIIDTEPIYLELIEPISIEENPFRDYYTKHGSGVFFLSFFVKDFQQHISLMENMGMPMNYKQSFANVEYAYFDSEDELGLALELKEEK
ncbi:VOC family protein [Gracilibacillus sp. D59]|uniref:VOC family protein n=1 Tax=Gracilibacillus sp. D59 TaxID=3457434 RepID=UPI003FCD13C1